MRFFKFFILLILFSKCNSFHNDIVYISIPKTDTHLLLRCIELLTGKNDLYGSHMQYSNDNSIALLQHCKNKKIYKFFTIRDPRDQLVSFVYWGLENNNKWTWKYYKNLSFDEILLTLIPFGDLWYRWNKGPYINGIKEYYESYLNWLKDKKHNFCVVKFENLVGSKGNGSYDSQITEIKKIADFMELKVSLKEIERISNQLFGESYTFRKGQIGSWKDHFKEIHKIAFKAVAGQLLIDLGYEKDLNW